MQLLDNLVLSQAHRYILFNCHEVDYFIRQHLRIVKNKNRRATPMDITRIHNETFSKWFQVEILQLYQQGDPRINEDLKWLAQGPSTIASRFKNVRRGANPAGVRSLGGQGVGVGVHGIAACNGGLCVGERRVLVSAVGSVVPIPDSERATGAVLLGPGVSSGGLSTSERRRRSQLLAVTWFLLPGVVVGYFFVGSVVVSRELRIGERKAVGPVVGNGLGGTSLRRKVLGAAGCTGGDGEESAFSVGNVWENNFPN
ncbi:hypothetical protein ACOSQ4_005289 [Xanthoceras sorbifolium]